MFISISLPDKILCQRHTIYRWSSTSSVVTNSWKVSLSAVSCIYSRIASTRTSVRSVSKRSAIASSRSTRYSGDWKWTRRGSSLALILCAISAHERIIISAFAQGLHIKRGRSLHRPIQTTMDPRSTSGIGQAAELAQLLNGTDRSVRSNSVHPGVRIQSGSPDADSRFAKALSVVPGVTTVANAAAEILFPAVSLQTADISGRCFRDQQPMTPSRAARDTDAAPALGIQRGRTRYRRTAGRSGVVTTVPGDGRRRPRCSDR